MKTRIAVSFAAALAAISLNAAPVAVDAQAKGTSLEHYWSFGAWHDLCKALVQHLVERYGLEEIQKWYFEVWNEPNLYRGFLEGTKSDYFRLYKESVLAVKEVHPSLKVGGPATSNFIADSRHDGEIQDNKKSVFYPQETINDQKWKGVWIEAKVTGDDSVIGVRDGSRDGMRTNYLDWHVAEGYVEIAKGWRWYSPTTPLRYANLSSRLPASSYPPFPRPL